MALNGKTSARDMKNWARSKVRGTKQQAKPPIDDEEDTEEEQDPAEEDPEEGEEEGEALQLATSEPVDPMNVGKDGRDIEEEIEAEGALAGDEEEGDPAQLLEEKIGEELAETLKARASELEELAQDVGEALLEEDIDIETAREAQAALPDDLRQDVVEAFSSLSPEEVLAFCQHLAEGGGIEDPELLAGFLRAVSMDSGDEDGPKDEDEAADEEEDDVPQDDEDEEDPAVDEDEEEEEDEDDKRPFPAKGKKKPPGKKPKKGEPAKGGKPPIGPR